MLSRMCASLFVLCLLLLATPAFAQAATANGKYKFILEDGLMKTVEFDVTSNERGASGYMIFTDEAKVVIQDVDGSGDVIPEEPVPFFMRADLTAMTIEQNRAIISGRVGDSSYRSYIGKWVQLVIEDNDGFEVPDKFIWSFCQPQPGGWIPSDAEVKDDKGAFMSWWATDFERRDDVGIPSPNLIPGILQACVSHPIQSYDFDIFKGDGVIQIRQ